VDTPREDDMGTHAQKVGFWRRQIQEFKKSGLS
jgi:hypothetical protein